MPGPSPADRLDAKIQQEIDLRRQVAEFNQLRQQLPGNLEPDPDAPVLGFDLPTPALRFLQGMGEYISQRRPDLAADIPAPDSTATDIGRAFVPTAAGFGIGMLTGGMSTASQMLAQVAGQVGLEALDPTATREDLAKTGALTIGGEAAGRTVLRAVTGARAARRATSGRAIARTTSERLRTVAETLGGGRILGRANQNILNRAWAQAIGESGDSISREMRQRAFTRITTGMDDILPTRTVDVTEAFVLLDDMPAFAGKNRLAGMIARAETSPRGWQDAMRVTRDLLRKIARSPDATMASELNLVFDALSEAGIDAGADKVASRVFRTQYKNLMLLESKASLRRTGDALPFSTEDALFKSYGNTVARGQGNVDEFTQRAVDLTYELAEDVAQREASSGTAQRALQTGAAIDAIDVVTGAQNPGAFSGTLGAITLGPTLSVAALGRGGPIAGASGVAGTFAADVERRRRERRKKATQ